jgi:hypothetical protein
MPNWPADPAGRRDAAQGRPSSRSAQAASRAFRRGRIGYTAPYKNEREAKTAMGSRGERNEEIGRLIDELVDRWAPIMQSKSWARRLALLAEIHEQLLEDLGNFDVFAEVTPHFIAKLVDRLDDGEIGSEEQAHIYANSGDPRHRRLAGAWFQTHRAGPTGPSRPTKDDRRTRPRRTVNLPTSVATEGRKVDCRLIDISDAGALVEAPALTPPLGAEVDLDLPSVGPATGAVVRRAPPHFAMAFRQPVDAATVY